MKPDGHGLSRWQLVAYGGLAAPVAFAGLPLYLNAPDFYASEYAVALTPLAVILLAMRFLDAVQDPLIGYWSDRNPHLRHLHMGAAALLLVVSFFLLFNPPAGVPHLAWFAATLLLASFSFSVVSINLNTLGALWSASRHAKTAVVAVREAAAILGLLIALILPNYLRMMTDARTAFLVAGIVLAVIMAPALAVFFAWFKKHPHLHRPAARQRPPRIGVLADMPRSMIIFFTIYAISMLAAAIPVVLVLFFVRDYLNAEAWTGAFLAIYFFAGFASMPIWSRLSRKYGKRTAWALGMVLAIICFSGAGFLSPGAFIGYGFVCAGSGLALGTDLMLPYSILADELQTSERNDLAAVHFGILAFIAKAMLALASAMALPLLDVAGFRPAAENSDEVLSVLAATYALAPCAIKLLAVFLLLWDMGSRRKGKTV